MHIIQRNDPAVYDNLAHHEHVSLYEEIKVIVILPVKIFLITPFRTVFTDSLQRQKPKKETIRPRLGTSRTNEARRQPNSGAMWFAKGDILLDHALMEVKERGTKNARGEKTISIPKEWLTKQAEEAFQEGREFWYLAFAYKNDDEVYIIKTLDHEIELMKELRKLTEENALLQEKLKEQESS